MGRMARKPKPESGKRYPLNMRTTRELRERIIAAAHASGRSLVQEVEYRLEQSFEKEDREKLIATISNQTATAAAEKIRIILMDQHREGVSENPAESNQKDDTS